MPEANPSSDALARARASIAAAQPKETPREQPPQKADPPAEQPGTDPAEGSEGAEPEGADQDQPGEPSTGEPDLGALKAFAKAGQIRALVKALGEDPKEYDVHPARLRRARDAEAAAAARATELESLKAKLASEQAELVAEKSKVQARSQFAETVETSLGREDWIGVARAIASRLPQGMTFAQFTAKVAQSGTSNPVDLETRRELAELKRWKQEQEQKAQGQTAEQQKANDLQHIKSQLAKHDVTKLDGFEAAVYGEMQKAWDPKLGAFSRTLKEVADDLVKRERAKAAKLLGVKPVTKPAAAPRQQDGRFAIPAPKTTTNVSDAALAQARQRAQSKLRPAR